MGRERDGVGWGGGNGEISELGRPDGWDERERNRGGGGGRKQYYGRVDAIYRNNGGRRGTPPTAGIYQHAWVGRSSGCGGRGGGIVDEEKRADKNGGKNEGCASPRLPTRKRTARREAKKRGTDDQRRTRRGRTGLTWDRMSTSFPFPSSPHWLPSTTSMPYGRP